MSCLQPLHVSASRRGDKQDLKFRTKLKVAAQLIQRALTDGDGIPRGGGQQFLRQHEGFKQKLEEFDVGHALALKPSHDWWHKVDEIGSLWEAVPAAGWEDAQDPGD